MIVRSASHPIRLSELGKPRHLEVPHEVILKFLPLTLIALPLAIDPIGSAMIFRGRGTARSTFSDGGSRCAFSTALTCSPRRG